MGFLRWLFGGEQRYADEQDYIVELDQEPWPKAWVWLEGDVPVRGISRYQRTAAEFMRGTGRSVELVREPTNRVDPDAVMVLARWQDSQGAWRVGTVGYLPRELAKEMADDPQAAQAKAQLRTLFLPRRGKSAGIRLDLKRPRTPRRQRREGESRA